MNSGFGWCVLLVEKKTQKFGEKMPSLKGNTFFRAPVFSSIQAKFLGNSFSILGMILQYSC